VPRCSFSRQPLLSTGKRQVSRTAALPRAADASPVTLPLSTADAAVKVPAFRALVIGINRYAPAGADGWQPLQSARARTPRRLPASLASDYGFSVQTLLDGDATRAALLNALDELATSGPDGADLIYFAGHGFYDETLQEGYWIPADARKTVGGRPAKEDWALELDPDTSDQCVPRAPRAGAVGRLLQLRSLFAATNR
jgi:hypothetical protein